MGAQSNCRIELEFVFTDNWGPHCESISWHPIITIACVLAFSLSIKVIAETKAPATCALAEGTICMCKHTGHRKKDLIPHPHPPVQIARVYTCVLMRGGWWLGERWQRASTEPTKYLCLHNTQGQTLRASCCKKLLQIERAVGRAAAQSSECPPPPPRQEKKPQTEGVFP